MTPEVPKLVNTYPLSPAQTFNCSIRESSFTGYFGDAFGDSLVLLMLSKSGDKGSSAEDDQRGMPGFSRKEKITPIAIRVAKTDAVKSKMKSCFSNFVFASGVNSTSLLYSSTIIPGNKKPMKIPKIFIYVPTIVAMGLSF